MSLISTALGREADATGVANEEWSGPALIPLVECLGDALAASKVRYCQWKGRVRYERWATGAGDLDLLVDRTSAGTFASVLDELGFKPAIAPPHLQLPGVLSWLGLDSSRGRLIHVHAHFRLFLGRPWRRHFHLPIERALLDSAVQRRILKAPSPELELVLFVLQATLRHGPGDLVRRRDPRWLFATRSELGLLEDEASRTALVAAIERHAGEVGVACFDRCLAALRSGSPARRRVVARIEIEWRLRAHARLPAAGAVVSRLVSRARGAARLRRGNTGTKRLLAGGAVIALVGGDGAGKSTCARSLEAVLGSELMARRAHLGSPPRSLLTLVVGGALIVARGASGRLGGRGRAIPAHFELLRFLCTARDRFRLYRRMSRFAASGGIAVCERYPMWENRALVGPSAAQGSATAASGRLAELLRRLEESYYDRIALPDQVVVLRVRPETAVRRKPEEPAEYVRSRALGIWSTDWSRVGARVVDADAPLADVLASVRSTIWSSL